jgi:hypothetical protein
MNIIIDQLEKWFAEHTPRYYQSGIHVRDWWWRLNHKLDDRVSHPVIAPAVLPPSPVAQKAHANTAAISSIANRGVLGAGISFNTGAWVAPSGQTNQGETVTNSPQPQIVVNRRHKLPQRGRKGGGKKRGRGAS